MSYNIAGIREHLAKTNSDEFSFDVMSKCTSSCFLSFKESELLPTEKRCLRNCFSKHQQFNDHLASETGYQFRAFFTKGFADRTF